MTISNTAVGTKRYRIAADIGGTFTDVVVQDTLTGEFRAAKYPTTPSDLSEGILRAFGQIIDDFSDVEFAVHGTTQGLNALLSRSGSRIMLLTTAGARDSFFIMRGSRPRNEMYNNKFQRSEQLVRRRDTLEIGGRLDYQGKEIAKLKSEDLETAVEHAKANGIQSVAVCFLFSFKNPDHEIAAREFLEQNLPGISVSLSHEVAREWREAERAASTVADAYISPVVRRYLGIIESRLEERGLAVPLFVTRSSGGLMSIKQASKQPIQTLFSGPVGGIIGASEMTGRFRTPNIICADVGGTSFDVSLVVDGKPRVVNQTTLSGMDIIMPVVDIESIGAGAGSIAYIESGGLRVGPESAGAEPGPACYGKGGKEPTVTDAQVFLNRFQPRTELGGAVRVDRAKAEESLSEIARSLGIDAETLAEGILDITNAKMADAIRRITVEQGIEPRDFSIVAFGGAGAMHAAFIAEALEVTDVVVPPLAGVFSAWGMLHSPMRHDLALPFNRFMRDLDEDEIYRSFEDQASLAKAHLDAETGGSPEIDYQYLLDLRYDGQEYTVTVEIPQSRTSISEISEIFHEAYNQRYGHSHRNSPVEIVSLRLVATVPMGKHLASDNPPKRATQLKHSERDVMFRGRWVRTRIFDGDDLSLGDELDGPLIVDTGLSTIVVPPGSRLIVEAQKVMRIHVGSMR
ncbi:hydantoinase/oxoprolinase family protein [Mesorhizobium sp. M4A.F.Ca.ET.022.05.2.1]|uniref:hydantoinase/oxoprolinase family protein n=1 Tax=Mesorhizobium sp. M4A.F.Ca.ET.022.05.2.1 TaxID=2496653 RepID=UPI000FCAB598|nr:hydantoinase/oxoprolinase family protein [Mesorhizobium sp. M4A.F.Ca.ET.022.05.2.1]RVC82573.1 hydantoinase/oxoprolinase family protein [Mesorhizobium sp. M4A.F.Ca.ET.022.05.2.1]